jgi:hypothetical protein
MRIIPANSATAALRRIAFTLVDATDLITPEDISVTGVKVSLSIDGGTPANSTNDIVKVSGSTGEYYLELTQTEANQTAGALVRGALTPSGCALTKLTAQIGPGGVFATTVDANVVQVSGDSTAADTLELFAEALDQATGQLDSGSLADGTITAAKIATDAITADKIAADAIGASELAAGAVSEIQSGLATASALATVAGYIDTEIATLQTTVDRIEADTQDLQAQVGVDGAGLTAIGDTRLANLDAAVSTRSTVTTAQVNAEVDTALADVGLTTTVTGRIDAAVSTRAAAADLTTVDTVVDAIKAKTDSLTFTEAGHVDANVQRINDVELAGDGSGTPWGPV